MIGHSLTLLCCSDGGTVERLDIGTSSRDHLAGHGDLPLHNLEAQESVLGIRYFCVLFKQRVG